MHIVKTRKFIRGQVWMVVEPISVTKAYINAGGRLEAKSRPYLIISAQGILDSGTICIQCIPITSNVEKEFDGDFIFENQNGNPNKLRLSQITVKDSKDFVRYLYTFDDATMKEIDSLVMQRFGFSEITEPTYLSNVCNVQRDYNVKTFLANNELDMHDVDDATDNKLISNFIHTDCTPDTHCDEICENDDISDTQETPVEQAKPTTSKGKTRTVKWTVPVMKEFMSDVNNMTIDEVCNKYDYNRRQVAKARYYCKTRLLNMGR